MSLSIRTGPKWEKDSHNNINEDTTRMNIKEKIYGKDLYDASLILNIPEYEKQFSKNFKN